LIRVFEEINPVNKFSIMHSFMSRYSTHIDEYCQLKSESCMKINENI